MIWQYISFCLWVWPTEVIQLSFQYEIQPSMKKNLVDIEYS